MKTLVSTSLILALAVCPMITLAADRGDGDVTSPAGRSFKKEVACGESETLVSNAPSGTAVTVIVDSCSCKDPTVVLQSMQGLTAKDLCSLKPGEDCMKDIPTGHDAIVGITADAGSGSCKLTVYVRP